MAELRYRGLEVVVDKTEAAEFDIKGLQISETLLDVVARSLKAVTYSDHDLVVNGARVRTLGDYQYVFFVSRDKQAIVITICGVVPVEDNDATEGILRALDFAAMLRSATGV